MMQKSYIDLIKKNLSHPLVVLLLLLLVSLIVFSIVRLGEEVGVVLIGLFIFIPLTIASIANIRIGFSVIFLAASFMFIFKRVTMMPIKMGVLIDFFYYPILLGVLISRPRLDFREKLRNKVYLLLILWYIYLVLEALNPEASLQAWILGFRINLRMLLIVLSAAFVFNHIKYVKVFITLFFVVALIACLYGFYQEFIGLPSFDQRWLMSDETRAKLNFYGQRKWSIMGNSTDFGMFMAVSSVFFFIISFGPYKFTTRLVSFISATLMMYAMSFSGTRTAYVLFIAGVVFYLVNNIQRKHSIVIFAGAIILFLGIMYGPFDSNSNVRRIRSTFRPAEDASYQMRENKQERIRPYIYSHPIGGGIFTTGAEGTALAPGHALSGFQTDSLYLERAMEVGWIGFFIYLALFGSVVITGILNIQKAKNLKIKNLLLAFTTFFFSLSIAGYTQETMDQFPFGIIFYSSILLVNRIIKFDKLIS